jgi:hypothetical protein
VVSFGVTARRLLAAFLVATAGAATIGVVRQRRELVQRRGQLQSGLSAPAGWLGARLARWTPSPPSTTPGKIVARVWAAPLTAMGVLVAFMSGSRPVWDERWQCLVARGVRGPSALALRAVGARANTIGHVVLTRPHEPPVRLLAHEAVHVRQAERLGVLLVPAYVWLAARYGYRNNPLEVAARAGAVRISPADA